MVVFVHSFGSIWQDKSRKDGGTSVWNTTGVDDGRGIRPRSKVYGQVALGQRAQLELNKQGAFKPSAWVTSGLSEHAGIRRLQLLVRASADCVPGWYLVTVTEGLIGALLGDGWDASETQIVSHSSWNQHQEIMLLMRPFGWLKADRGTATLVPGPRGCEWRTEAWKPK
jgi:hypothetical protein